MNFQGFMIPLTRGTEKVSLLTFICNSALCRHISRAGYRAHIESLSKLQIQEPHLQECVDVAGGAEVCEAHKCILAREEKM